MMIKHSWKLLFLCALIFGSGCSLIVDLDECESNTDCSEKFGAASVCLEGVCDVPQVITPFCKDTLGNPGAPNTLTIGVILALTGDEAGFGKPLRNAIEVGYNDLEELKINGSELAVLFCDNKSSAEGSKTAARHLAEVVKVPAIIGPEFSDHIKPILEDITKPNKVVLISPSATAAVITTLDDDDLIWRTAPSDTFQAEAIAKLLGATKDALGKRNLPNEEIWVLTAGNGIYTNGLRDGLTANYPASINPNDIKNFTYPEKFGPWITENLFGKTPPNIVVVLGLAEAWDVANTIDDHYDNETLFIFGDGVKNQEKAEGFPSLAQRILGTAPQSVGVAKYTPYVNFRGKYTALSFKNPDQAQFLPHAYDAFYVIAIAAGANGFTGPQIAKGLKRLSKGEKVKPEQAGIEKAFSILRKNPKATVNYEGASGALDFDKNGDPSRAPITLWCFNGTTVQDENVLLNEDNVFQFKDDILFGSNACIKLFK